MAQGKLILDYIYEHESAQPDRVYLSQPIGGGKCVDYNWGQVLDQSRRMAAHLKAQGFEHGARIAILSKNCAHFFMAELAIWMAGGSTVAIFPTETERTLRYVLEHSGASLLFVGKLDTWEQQAAGVPQELPCIAFPLAPSTRFETWDAVTARTPPLTGLVQRAGDDMALLCYTSGSTGQPKGVMHSFGAVTRACEGMVKYVRLQFGPKSEVRMLSYLPLAHIYERGWLQFASLIDGQIHVFFAESLESFLQDLQRARPTAFISVPRLWLKFQQGVFAKIPPQRLDRLLGIPVLGSIVKRKVLKGLGLDHTLLASSASAPIPAELITWYRRLGLNLMEGYAMTEDFGYSHASAAGFNAPGCVGVPLPGVEVRISEEGEILIRSPGQLMGYYRRPDLDAESFTADGFFRTGDKGERNADGLLKLTGRVKELFKTAKGKYVAPAPIENRLNAHPMVEMSIVSGVGQASAYAMVVLAEDLRLKVGDAAMRMRVQAEFSQLLEGVNAELPDYEKLKLIVVSAEPWTIENGCLTPTMKIRRSHIESAAEAKLVAWFATAEKIHWA